MNGSVDHAIGSLQSDVNNIKSDITGIKADMERIRECQKEQSGFVSEIKGSWNAVRTIGKIIAVLLTANIAGIVIQVFF